jgi:shikimate dehydrogenase
MDDNGRTKLFAVTGNPILHSRSPLLFHALFERFAMDAGYFRLAADSAPEAIRTFRELGLEGMNVTFPFKTEMAAWMNSLDEAAMRIGGVNTIVKEGSKLKGYNTDHIGVSGALRSRGIGMDGKRCVVLGAGGAGRAAVFGLVRENAEVTLVNRSHQKAAEVASALGCRAAPWSALPSLLPETDILVSALPPGIDVVRSEWLPEGVVLMDANYVQSSLAEIARESGHPYISGEEWLLHQAIPAFNLFGGACPESGPLPDIFRLQRPPSTQKDNISLIGFMGSGKSTIGRKLAAALGFSFCDTDDLIEKEAGRSVAEIFRTDGEESFRIREKAILSDLRNRRRTVFACGGGAVVEIQNQKNLRENSLVVWLHSTIETCLKRIETGSRPLLHEGKRDAEARELFGKRRGAYARTADLVIRNEKSVDETVRKIDDEIDRTIHH